MSSRVMKDMLHGKTVKPYKEGGNVTVNSGDSPELMKLVKKGENDTKNNNSLHLGLRPKA